MNNLGSEVWNGQNLLESLIALLAKMRFNPDDCTQVAKATRELCCVLNECTGITLQERWHAFEQQVWPEWPAGRSRPQGRRWTAGTRLIILGRFVQPRWNFLCAIKTATWVARLPNDEPLAREAAKLDAIPSR